MQQLLKRIILVKESRALHQGRELCRDGHMRRQVTTWWQKRLKLPINEGWFGKRIGVLQSIIPFSFVCAVVS